jgi:hypothetical protein
MNCDEGVVRILESLKISFSRKGGGWLKTAARQIWIGNLKL